MTSAPPKDGFHARARDQEVGHLSRVPGVHMTKLGVASGACNPSTGETGRVLAERTTQSTWSQREQRRTLLPPQNTKSQAVLWLLHALGTYVHPEAQTETEKEVTEFPSCLDAFLPVVCQDPTPFLHPFPALELRTGVPCDTAFPDP